MFELLLEGYVFEDAHGAEFLETLTFLSFLLGFGALLGFGFGFLKRLDGENGLSFDFQILLKFVSVGSDFFSLHPF